MIFEVSEKCTRPFGRDLLIKAARLRARGISWQTIARGTEHSEMQLARLPFDHAEIWEPLYKRAEKLQLQEAEGEGLRALNILLEDKDQIAAEKAARELLVHRRHIERRRYQPPRHKDTKTPQASDAALPVGDADDSGRETCSDLVPWCLGGEEEPPEELRGAIIHLACRRAQGEDLLVTAAEIGRPHEEVARWAFIYAKSWDRHWPTARLETARFYAARALKTLTSLAFGPDRKLAARAARTLLIHRRHMHWTRENPPQRHRDLPAVAGTEKEELLHAARASSRTGVLLRGPKGISVPQCLCGEKGWRSRDGPQ